MAIATHRSLLSAAAERFNAGDIEGYLQILYTPDCHFHFFPPELPQGHEGARLFYGSFLAAFPDCQLVVEEVMSEGDRLAARFHLEMTQTGDFNGIAATGRRAHMAGITIMRFEGGRVAERWSQNDFLSLLQQLGAIPA